MNKYEYTTVMNHFNLNEKARIGSFIEISFFNHWAVIKGCNKLSYEKKRAIFKNYKPSLDYSTINCLDVKTLVNLISVVQGRNQQLDRDINSIYLQMIKDFNPSTVPIHDMAYNIFDEYTKYSLTGNLSPDNKNNLITRAESNEGINSKKISELNNKIYEFDATINIFLDKDNITLDEDEIDTGKIEISINMDDQKDTHLTIKNIKDNFSLTIRREKVRFGYEYSSGNYSLLHYYSGRNEAINIKNGLRIDSYSLTSGKIDSYYNTEENKIINNSTIDLLISEMNKVIEIIKSSDINKYLGIIETKKLVYKK